MGDIKRNGVGRAFGPADPGARMGLTSYGQASLHAKGLIDAPADEIGAIPRPGIVRIIEIRDRAELIRFTDMSGCTLDKIVTGHESPPSD